MPRVLKREAARLGLVAQWVWYAENASVDVADRFLEAVEETLVLLSGQPEIGKALVTRKPELQGMRWFRVARGYDKILLFYFPREHAVELVRVIHGSRGARC